VGSGLIGLGLPLACGREVREVLRFLSMLLGSASLGSLELVTTVPSLEWGKE